MKPDQEPRDLSSVDQKAGEEGHRNKQNRGKADSELFV